MSIEIFIKNWKDELRSQVQPIVKAGKRKPVIAIICIEQKVDEEFIDICKDIGFIGSVYELPRSVIKDSTDFIWKTLDLECDGLYVQKPLPEDFFNPIAMHNFRAKGILNFLKSQNIDPLAQLITLELMQEGCQVVCGEVRLSAEDVIKLERMAILEDAIEYWREEDD